MLDCYALMQPSEMNDTGYPMVFRNIIHFVWILSIVITGPCFGDDINLNLSPEEQSWINKHYTVRVRVGNTPPFMFTDGKIQGIAIDYLTYIFNRNGMKLQYVNESEVTWPQALKYIERHDVVDMVPTAKITEERKKTMIFTNEYIFAPWVIFTRSDADFISSIEDLKGKTVSVEEGFVIHTKLKQDYPEINLKVASASLENYTEIPIKDLSTGLADAYIGNLLSTTYIIQTKGYSNIKVAAPTPFDNHNQAMAIRNDWPELAGIINKTLSAMTQDQHAAIRDKWLSIRYEYGISKKDLFKWVLSIAGVASLFIGFVLFWNKRLKTEVSFRKNIEKNLLESQNRLRTLVQTIPDLIWLKDVNGVYIDCNTMFERFFGAEKKDIVGKTDYDFVDKELADFFRENDRRALAADKPSSNEEWLTLADTGYRGLFDTIKTPMRDAEGKIIGVLGIAHDITGRRQAEHDYQMLFREMLDGFALHEILCNEAGKPANYRFLAVNPAFERMTGLKAATIVGKTVLDILPDIEHQWIETYGRVALTGEPAFFENYSAELDKHFEVTAFQPAPNQFACIFADITDRKRVMEERARLDARLQQAQKMEAIGNLAGGIAHDLNNILFPISGLAEMMLDDISPDSHIHENIVQIINSAKRGSDLVKQILAFSRQSNPQKLPVRIQPILKEVLKLSRAAIPMNIEIKSNINSECGMVSADPTQVHQIAMNLITNAYHALEQTGGTIHVVLKEALIEIDDLHDGAVKSGKYACITISDNGTGIDKSSIDKIFDPYFTTKELGKGTGLGLSVVHGIVKDHGGDVRVYSELGRGTAFHVYLPLLKDAIDALDVSATRKYPTGSERILLVDDEEPVAMLMQKMLEKQGYQVTAIMNSLDGLNMFQSNPSGFDLVISDRGMPNMTGEQLAQELIAIRPEIPIILCTGFCDENDEKRARALGVRCLLKKPVARDELTEMVRNVLDDVK